MWCGGRGLLRLCAAACCVGRGLGEPSFLGVKPEAKGSISRGLSVFSNSAVALTGVPHLLFAHPTSGPEHAHLLSRTFCKSAYSRFCPFPIPLLPFPAKSIICQRSLRQVARLSCKFVLCYKWLQSSRKSMGCPRERQSGGHCTRDNTRGSQLSGVSGPKTLQSHP